MKTYCPHCEVALDLHDGPDTCAYAESKARILEMFWPVGGGRELRDDADGRPPPCEDHREVQHRDRRPPWCDSCGWRHEVPARPAQKVVQDR